MCLSLPSITRCATLALVVSATTVPAAEPPALNPFGPRPTTRDDAVPGYVELSDGTIHCGMLYLTRDMRLKTYDKKLQRQREIPLRVVRQIDCTVKKEWIEKEWRFKETTNDVKMYTGRKYPAREYLHTITLRDDRKIDGPLAALIYLKPTENDAKTPGSNSGRHVEPLRFTLHKRDKGKPGTKLKSLIYVRHVGLGEEALEEGRKKAIQQAKTKKTHLKKKGH